MLAFMFKYWAARRLLRMFPVAVMAATLVAGCSAVDDAINKAAGTESKSSAGGYTIVSIADGDTLTVVRDGEKTKVRTVFIDTPEKYATRFGYSECGGKQASAYAKKIAHKGDKVELFYSGRDEVDKYGRYLAFVKFADGKTWQQKMVRSGWADVFVYRGNDSKFLPGLKKAAERAKAENRGVYKLCGGDFHKKEA